MNKKDLIKFEIEVLLATPEQYFGEAERERLLRLDDQLQKIMIEENEINFGREMLRKVMGR